MHRKALIIFAFCASCSQFPALEGTIGAAARDAPYPALTPLAQLLARADAAAAGPAAFSSDPALLAARLRDLRRRAAALRGPVIDAATMRRISAALQ